MEMEAMKKLKTAVEKCLDELAKKSDLSPAETKAALDGMELREMLLCEMENCKMQEEKEYSERGYSRSDRPYRQYHITSFGRPVHMMYPEENYNSMRGSYNGNNGNYSGDYGVNGWYRSNNGGSYYSEPYYAPEYSDRGRGYSRHSIGDRIIAMMEREMDKTESDYEKEELHKFIRMIRSAAD